MAELWVGSRGGVLLEPPERRSRRKHHLLRETQDDKGEKGEREEKGEEKQIGLINKKKHETDFK